MNNGQATYYLYDGEPLLAADSTLLAEDTWGTDGLRERRYYPQVSKVCI